MSELKHCPFCGRAPIALQVGEDKNGKQYQVICPWTDHEDETGGCGASSGFHDTLSGAIKAWNTRVITRATGEIEELLKAVARWLMDHPDQFLTLHKEDSGYQHFSIGTYPGRNVNIEFDVP